MERRPLGNTGLSVSPIGFGAFKIGRNQGIKYPRGYALPDQREVDHLLNAVLDIGINYIDTAPAYGVSEQRIGSAIGHRRSEFILSTKIGETFTHGQSSYDFSAQEVRNSLHRSLKRLATETVDIVFIHSHGQDLEIINQTDVVSTLIELRDQGLVRAIGLSGKTVQGAQAALAWADVIMVQYHLDDKTHEQVIAKAHNQGIGVVVKKGLASGQLAAPQAIGFVLGNSAVSSLVVGGLSMNHIRENVHAAQQSPWQPRSTDDGQPGTNGAAVT